MSSPSARRAATLAGLSLLALAACGGSPPESPVGPLGLGDDGAVFTTLGNGPGHGGADGAPGSGVCDGTGGGTCDGTGQAPGNGQGNGQGRGSCEGAGPGSGNGPGSGACEGTVVSSDPDDLQALLLEALQEEHLAETTYRRVLADFGQVGPFAFIAESEALHVRALVGLFARREWAAPRSVWTLGNVPAFDTLPAACAGAVAIEIEDGALYERYLSRDDLPSDVVNVFTHLQAASLEHHLPAFESCR